MNLLYCGDSNIIDGLLISVLSVAHNVSEELNIYVLTMDYKNELKKYEPLSEKIIGNIEKIIKKYNSGNSIKLINITREVEAYPPSANINTRFTPYCMLRLYADLIEELPSKILYLDSDVVCLKNPKEFYDMDNSDFELVGVLDYYGRRFYKRKILTQDYINSGVLLLNLDLIRQTGLFQKCRKACQNKRMLLPDQAVLNRFAQKKLIVDRKYNEQKSEKSDTVFRHFSTTFRFYPTFHIQTIKPWDIDKLHGVLKEHSFDHILSEYCDYVGEVKNG